jgi:uncharacterized protein YkwD
MRLKQVIIIIACIICIANSLNAQISKASKLKTLLNSAKYDRKQKIERIAALKFHKLINDYRKQNNLGELKWDESLWLTCRNHDIWMNANGELAHDQKKGTEQFSGEGPGDRYRYVTSGKGKCYWSGENTLYNNQSGGHAINEIAANIAKCAFEQWKDSPPHNLNMLGPNHRAHGVAFYLGAYGRVYGTDLFVSGTDDKYTKTNDQLTIK